MATVTFLVDFCLLLRCNRECTLHPQETPMTETKERPMTRLIWLILAALIPALIGLAFAVIHNRIGIDAQGRTLDKAPGAGARPIRNALDVLTAVAADLDKVEAGRRPLRRYLTLTHLHNDRRLSDADLQEARKTLYQLAAALSPPGRLSELRAVDAEQTVFAVDLGELGLDEDAAWRRLLQAYPYGLSYADSADARLRDAEEKVQRHTGSKLPYLRGDWFAVTAARPPAGTFKLATALPEAVSLLAQTYGARTLDLEAAAGELAVEPARLEGQIRDEPRLRQKMGLAPLIEGGAVTRTAWESLEYATSPFQAASNDLNLGTPLHVR
jgi:hypothetical protein